MAKGLFDDLLATLLEISSEAAKEIVDGKKPLPYKEKKKNTKVAKSPSKTKTLLESKTVAKDQSAAIGNRLKRPGQMSYNEYYGQESKPGEVVKIKTNQVNSLDSSTKKKTHPLVKKLRNKENMRDALIYSTIFEKKI